MGEFLPGMSVLGRKFLPTRRGRYRLSSSPRRRPSLARWGLRASMAMERASSRRVRASRATSTLRGGLSGDRSKWNR